MGELLMVLGLILLNGVFAGAEIAVLSIRKTRLQELIDAGSGSAGWVARLRADPERFLATVQVGITVVGATAAAFGGASIAARLAPALEPVLGRRAEEAALAIVVATVSYLSLVLGELVPKSLALRAGETYALFIARPLTWMSWAAAPIVWFLTRSSNVVLRLFGDRTSFIESRLSSEELQQLVEEAATAGTVDAGVGEIASRALAFSELDCGAVMIPRNRIVSVPRSAGVGELAELALITGHTRILVYDKGPDDVVGFVNVRELLARAHQDPETTLEGALHPIPFVPTSMPARVLLRDLQRKRQQIAVVVDEQGTIRGLVTMEDLVEELVGEIMNEHDRQEGPIVHEPDGSATIDASTPIHTVNWELDLALPESEGFTTIGGLVLELAGRIPAPGDRLEVGDRVLEVLEASHRRVKRVRIGPRPG